MFLRTLTTRSALVETDPSGFDWDLEVSSAGDAPFRSRRTLAIYDGVDHACDPPAGDCDDSGCRCGSREEIVSEGLSSDRRIV
jgi:hypothetical protein